MESEGSVGGYVVVRMNAIEEENAALKAELAAAQDDLAALRLFAANLDASQKATLREMQTTMRQELAAAQKDAERLEFIIEKALESRTGVTIDYHKYVEDGQVVERGFRMAWFHHLNPRFKTLREAIDAAIYKEMAK